MSLKVVGNPRKFCSSNKIMAAKAFQHHRSSLDARARTGFLQPWRITNILQVQLSLPKTSGFQTMLCLRVSLTSVSNILSFLSLFES